MRARPGRSPTLPRLSGVPSGFDASAVQADRLASLVLAEGAAEGPSAVRALGRKWPVADVADRLDGRLCGFDLPAGFAGRNTPSNIASELEISRQWASQRLQTLEAAGAVENIGGGVYEFRDDPREEE